MRQFLFRALRARLKRVAGNRLPDQIIGGIEDPYLLRWWIIPRNRLLNIYLHHFLRSDDDRALHDHPWPNASLLLEGAYNEHTIRAGGTHVRTRREAGDIKLRGPRFAHRIELLPDPDFPGRLQPCWTLFVTGPKVRTWGFHCPKGWVPWRIFTSDTRPGERGNVSNVGQGCGEDA